MYMGLLSHNQKSMVQRTLRRIEKIPSCRMRRWIQRDLRVVTLVQWPGTPVVVVVVPYLWVER